MSDSQKVTQQPALTTASGRSWLVVAGVISLLCLVMLWFMRELEPMGAASTGIVIIIVAYLAMIVVRYRVNAPRVKLWTLAVLTLGIVATFLTVSTLMILGA